MAGEDGDLEEEGEGSAAEAFEALRAEFGAGVARLSAEVAALRQAIDARLDRPMRVQVPDYSATLADLTARLDRIDRKPAPRVDAEAVASAIGRPLQELREVSGEVQSAARALRMLDTQIRTEREVRAEKLWWGGVGVVLGGVAWVGLSGPVARKLPVSWSVPEKMAAATMGEDRATAGQHMIASVDPQGWAETVAAVRLFRANRAAISHCRQRATESRVAKTCAVKLVQDKQP